MDDASARPPQTQASVNASVWRSGRFVRSYASQELRPVESVILSRYRRELSRRLLELGCGAGRLTAHLARTASQLHAIDLSPQMIEHCRRSLPGVEFSVMDLENLSAFADASFDAVVAPFNVLDVLGDAERGRVLEEIRRVLSASGLLVMSTHNLGARELVKAPVPRVARTLRSTVASIVRYPVRRRNNRRLASMESEGPDHAVLNDSAHDYSLLHYYISRDAQEAQLASHGFTLLECLAIDGGAVAPGELASDEPELHYVARRS